MPDYDLSGLTSWDDWPQFIDDEIQGDVVGANRADESALGAESPATSGEGVRS